MLDDKDEHLVTQLVSDLRGIGTRDRDNPEEGERHVAGSVLRGVRNLADVWFLGPRAVYHL